jgi:hypothetical protein
MTAREWVLSLLIAFHLVAVTLAAIPRPVPGRLTPVSRSDADPIAAVFNPPLTHLANELNSAQRQIHRTSSGFRAISRPYIAAGIPQNWSMFSNVLVIQRYLRVDFHVRGSGKTPVVYRQLVLPSQNEGEPRLSYRSADKAVRVLMGSFLSRLRDEEEADVSDDSQGDPRSVEPLLRHFATRFAQELATPLDEITRMELWAGSVPIPPPGEVPQFPAELRREVLNRYRTLEPAPAPISRLPVGTTQPQGDLTWQLVHVAEKP